MKLEMTLPEQPGFLHAVPLLNLFCLILLFFLLGPAMILQTGVEVDLPPSPFQMRRFQHPVVVTLGPGDPSPRIHFDRDPVTLEGLASRLEALRHEGASTHSIVLLQTDAGTPVGMERAVTNLILEKQFRLALVGRHTAEPPAGLDPR